jgi:hypothetical protein
MNDNPLLAKFRDELLKRGPAGIKSIGIFFRQVDDDRSRRVDFEEFCRGIINHNVRITSDEANELFRLFDKNQNGQIDYEEFLVNIRVNFENIKYVIKIINLLILAAYEPIQVESDIESFSKNG